MNDQQRALLASARADLTAVALELRDERQAAPDGSKAPLRAILRPLDHALAQLKLAERVADNGR